MGRERCLAAVIYSASRRSIRSGRAFRFSDEASEAAPHTIDSTPTKLKVKSTKVEIPFHRAAVGEEEVEAVSNVIRSGWLTTGPKAFEFEKEFAKYVGAQHAIAVSTGTAALHLSLEAAGVRSGDEVLLPTNTFTATAEAVTYLGARPVLVDIDPETMNIDPADAAWRITPRTKAIIPVHLGGQPCDMEEIANLARAHHLRIVEDAAHALPSEYRGRRIGQISEFTCFSFYATKTLTTGEGGMITTDNAEAAERMCLMRLHGIERDAWKRYRADGTWSYEVLEAGFKNNLSDLQSAIGLVQLARCDALKQARESIARRYSDAFSSCEELAVPTIRSDRGTSWHLYILRLRLDSLTRGRNDFIAALRRRGVACSVHFIPLHMHPYYRGAYGYGPGDFPRAEREYYSCVSLPIFPAMTEIEIDYVIREVLDTVAESRVARAGVSHGNSTARS
jgi:perosamine synthetase